MKIVSDTGPMLEARRARMELSPRQLFIGLVTEGFITVDEGVAAATVGAMPAAVEAAIATLPAPQQVIARITWASMRAVLRTDPLVDLLAASQGQTAADVDAFFETYAGV